MTEQQNRLAEIIHQETNFLENENIRWSECPQTVRQSLWLYIYYRINTGGFLKAVLSNDLMQTMTRADQHNRQNIYEICQFLYNHLPARCFGSPEKYREWLDVRRHINIDDLILSVKGEEFTI